MDPGCVSDRYSSRCQRPKVCVRSVQECFDTANRVMEPELYMAAASFEVLLGMYDMHKGKECSALTTVLEEAYAKLDINITAYKTYTSSKNILQRNIRQHQTNG